MGYFSNLAMEPKTFDYDHGYIPPEKQLLFRLEDLENRLCELTQGKTSKRDEGEYLSEDNLRYVLPEDFSSASNVCKAIDLAISDLQEQYGIYIGGQPAQEQPEADEITGMQVTFFDLLALQSHCVPLNAA